jgi:site-specific DNA recombinase
MSTGLTDELSDGAIKKLRAFAALARSVTRQVDHARAYAEQRGWIVDDRAVFLDDGISGAEFAARPGFVRLMNTLKPKPTFQALIMSEESRLGREAIETAYALKQLITSGVPVFFYMENRERRLESPTDKLLLSVTAFADELEREKARQRTYDAMVRKAESGQVTGGRVFGYDNVEVFADGLDANGKPRRSHVDRKINDREAAIVRRIFELCAHGHGMKMIASTLNQESAPSPRAQRGRPNGWAPSSVRSVLFGDLDRGEVVWNKTKKRNQWGQKRQRARPENEWMRRRVSALKIVSADLWNAAHARLDASRKTYLRGTSGQLWGRPPAGTTGKYLLTGLARCGCCGGGVLVKSRQHGRKRSFRYGCSSYHLRGTAICKNRLEALMDAADEAAFDMIERDVLDPSVLEQAMEYALQRLSLRRGDDDRLMTIEAEIDALGGELSRLRRRSRRVRTSRRCWRRSASGNGPGRDSGVNGTCSWRLRRRLRSIPRTSARS